jgi:hypothetical protein
MKYVTQNVFRYDKDGDKHVTYDEFVFYFLFRQILVLSSILERWPSKGFTNEIFIPEEKKES